MIVSKSLGIPRFGVKKNKGEIINPFIQIQTHLVISVRKKTVNNPLQLTKCI